MSPWINRQKPQYKTHRQTQTQNFLSSEIQNLAISNGFDLRHLFIFSIFQALKASPQTNPLALMRLVGIPNSLVAQTHWLDSVHGTRDLRQAIVVVFNEAWDFEEE